MALKDTAQNLQAAAVSPGLQRLREMRAFVNKWTDREQERLWKKALDFDNSPKRWDEEGEETYHRLMVEAEEVAAMVRFYQRILACAEEEERQEKGKAAKEMERYAAEIQRVEQEIKEKYKREKRLQISLEDMEEGETNGDDETGNGPTAAADGR